MSFRIFLLASFSFFSLGKTDAQSTQSSGNQNTSTVQGFAILDFEDKGNNTFQFKAVTPELRQTAGAPPSFYTYYWEFGDGHFSFAESPEHTYTAAGEMDARLFLTNNYSDGKPPPTKRSKKPKPKPKPSTLTASVDPVIHDNRSLNLQTNHNPAPEEEMALIFTYKNQTPQMTSGKLYLFFNEKRYPAPHFELLETRQHYGESAINADQLLGAADTQSEQPTDFWASSDNNAAAILGNDAVRIIGFEENTMAKVILEDANENYRDKAAWSFSGLKAGEERNLFMTMLTTPEMLKDTSAIITVKGVFVSDDGSTFDDYDLELEIVASHDPNLIAVSDNRMNFRRKNNKGLRYKVRFQNNGEGPANTVNVEVNIPEGLAIDKVKLLGYYPYCPICPDMEVTYSCLDTIVDKGGLVRGAKINFIYRNIYLPGTQQEGVDDRDSTKGFVQYEIKTTKKMKKESFRSRASIVFDKNPPVITRYTTTRFKPGFSPGIKVGLNHFPDDVDLNHYFVGAVFSPYKSHKWYLQPEVMLSFSSGDTESTMTSDTSCCILIDDPTGMSTEADTFFITNTTSTVESYRMDIVPLQIRKDLNQFISVGFGAQVSFDLYKKEKGVVEVENYAIPFTQPPTTVPILLNTVSNENSEPVTEQFINWDAGVFVDVFAGLVRAGPGIGLRGIYRFSETPNNYFQVYASWKF